ncbi:hypothetical protein L1887_13477 [Cichorium endivia]|nr:hypothetical protein L1887_13477 [Cichorium endivia]
MQMGRGSQCLTKSPKGNERGSGDPKGEMNNSGAYWGNGAMMCGKCVVCAWMVVEWSLLFRLASLLYIHRHSCTPDHFFFPKKELEGIFPAKKRIT